MRTSVAYTNQNPPECNSRTQSRSHTTYAHAHTRCTRCTRKRRHRMHRASTCASLRGTPAPFFPTTDSTISLPPPVLFGSPLPLRRLECRQERLALSLLAIAPGSVYALRARNSPLPTTSRLSPPLKPSRSLSEVVRRRSCPRFGLAVSVCVSCMCTCAFFRVRASKRSVPFHGRRSRCSVR